MAEDIRSAIKRAREEYKTVGSTTTEAEKRKNRERYLKYKPKREAAERTLKAAGRFREQSGYGRVGPLSFEFGEETAPVVRPVVQAPQYAPLVPLPQARPLFQGTGEAIRELAQGRPIVAPPVLEQEVQTNPFEGLFVPQPATREVYLGRGERYTTVPVRAAEPTLQELEELEFGTVRPPPLPHAEFIAQRMKEEREARGQLKPYPVRAAAPPPLSEEEFFERLAQKGKELEELQEKQRGLLEKQKELQERITGPGGSVGVKLTPYGKPPTELTGLKPPEYFAELGRFQNVPAPETEQQRQARVFAQNAEYYRRRAAGEYEALPPVRPAVPPGPPAPPPLPEPLLEEVRKLTPRAQ